MTLRDELGPDDYDRLAKAWRERTDKRHALTLNTDELRELPARYVTDNRDE